MIRIITNRSPQFLKAAYRRETTLVDHERHIPTRSKYITWEDGTWFVWRMNTDRVPIFIGRFYDLESAMFRVG
jgi:hypothetical protein